MLSIQISSIQILSIQKVSFSEIDNHYLHLNHNF